MSNTQLNNDWRIYAIEPSYEQDQQQIWFAIIDPILWSEWIKHLYMTTKEPRFAKLFEHTQFSHIDDGPIIMEISDSAELARLCIQKMEQTPCGCLLTTHREVDWDALITTLRKRLLASNGQTSMLLRYFEPRTLLPLLAAISDEERSLLFQPITQFYWFNRQWLMAPILGEYRSQPDYQWVISEQHIQNMTSILDQW